MALEGTAWCWGFLGCFLRHHTQGQVFRDCDILARSSLSWGTRSWYCRQGSCPAWVPGAGGGASDISGLLGSPFAAPILAYLPPPKPAADTAGDGEELTVNSEANQKWSRGTDAQLNVQNSKNGFVNIEHVLNFLCPDTKWHHGRM